MILFILATFLQEKRIHLERILTYLRKGKDQGVIKCVGFFFPFTREPNLNYPISVSLHFLGTDLAPDIRK